MTTATPENDLTATPIVRGRSRTQNLVAAALVAAVMAVVGPAAVHAGAVPVTLQIFPVALAAMVLPAQWAAASMLVYLVMGAIGIPVYAGGHAGLGTLFGPTGGYIFGFVAGAGLGALVRGLVAKRLHAAVADVACAVATVGAVYFVGWAWLVLGSTHLSPLAGFTGGVAPFVVPDLIKAGVAVLVAGAIRRASDR